MGSSRLAGDLVREAVQLTNLLQQRLKLGVVDRHDSPRIRLLDESCLALR